MYCRNILSYIIRRNVIKLRMQILGVLNSVSIAHVNCSFTSPSCLIFAFYRNQPWSAMGLAAHTENEFSDTQISSLFFPELLVFIKSNRAHFNMTDVRIFVLLYYLAVYNIFKFVRIPSHRSTASFDVKLLSETETGLFFCLIFRRCYFFHVLK